MMKLKFLFSLFLAFVFSACSESFTDSRDGQSYDVVKIGDLTWMAENLNFETAMSACPENDSRNCKHLGRLYSWAEAKSVCPEGWRLPTKEDFESLIASADGSGAVLKARDGWFKKGNGDDKLGFNALPAGYGFVTDAASGAASSNKFDGIGGYAYFWSAAEDSENRESNAYYLFLAFNSKSASVNSFSKSDLRSVRCVQ